MKAQGELVSLERRRQFPRLDFRQGNILSLCIMSMFDSIQSFSICLVHPNATNSSTLASPPNAGNQPDGFSSPNFLESYAILGPGLAVPGKRPYIENLPDGVPIAKHHKAKIPIIFDPADRKKHASKHSRGEADEDQYLPSASMGVAIPNPVQSTALAPLQPTSANRNIRLGPQCLAGSNSRNVCEDRMRRLQSAL